MNVCIFLFVFIHIYLVKKILETFTEVKVMQKLVILLNLLKLTKHCEGAQISINKDKNIEK